MRRVDLSGERPVSAAGSTNASVRILATQAHAVVIAIEPGGVVGRHPAVVSQLYVVVSGAGWVSGADGERVPIRAGQAVVWDAGEEHESGSEEGMIAVVIEAEALAV